MALKIIGFSYQVEISLKYSQVYYSKSWQKTRLVVAWFIGANYSNVFLFLAVQMAQSGQLTLELPYVIIGLGATPNFVEKLTVAIPPNSQTVWNIYKYSNQIT